MRVFKWAYVPRLVLGLVFAAFIWSCGQTTTSEGLTFSQYGAMIFCFILHRCRTEFLVKTTSFNNKKKIIHKDHVMISWLG